MHDITEGVARYDMALIIKNLIDLKYISLDIIYIIYIVKYNFLITV